MKNLTIVSLYLKKVKSYLVKRFSYGTAQTKEIQKGSSILLLSQLFLMPLEITPTVKLGV